MKRTALILAGAAAFDLGVMVVAAQAQQQTREAPPIPGRGAGQETAPSGLAVQDPTGPGGNGGCTPGLPNSGGSTGPCTDAASLTVRKAGTKVQEYLFLKIDAALSQRACIARRGEVVRHEGSEQCRLPGPSGSANPRAAPDAGTGTSPGGADIHKHDPALNFIKIDFHYTARTCIAQRGEVVTHDGVQQCALPADPGNNRVRPNRR